MSATTIGTRRDGSVLFAAIAAPPMNRSAPYWSAIWSR